MEEQINCKWLNKTFGEKCWICNGQLKKVNKEICRECKDRLKERKL